MPARMRIAYLILSHVDPPQVVRLVKRLRGDDPDCFVLVHHDPQTSRLSARAFDGYERVAMLEPPMHVEWGGFTQVEVILRAMDYLVNDGPEFDRLVLLSGQDYPLASVGRLRERLERSGDGELEHDGSAALHHRYLFAWYRLPRRLEGQLSDAIFSRLSGRFNDRQPFVHFVSGRIGCRLGIRSRKAPFDASFRPYKGTTWWSLSARCVAYVREYVAARPDVVAWYARRTLMPDESFFQTILYNAGRFSFRNDDGRFTRWNAPGDASPAFLQSSDLEVALASGKSFARKFDGRRDGDLLTMLDRLARESDLRV